MKSIGTAISLLLLAALTLRAGDIHTLRPRPKSAFSRTGAFTITRNTLLVIPDAPQPVTAAAVAWLQKLTRERIGDTLTLLRAGGWNGTGTAVLMGEKGSFSALDNALAGGMPDGEALTHPEGYVLDVSATRIVLAGWDPSGTFNAVTTLIQLYTVSGQTATVAAAHVWDYPDYSVRWAFLQHNALVQVSARMRGILDTMAYHKMNGAQHSDFKYGVLSKTPSNYPDSVRLLKRLADQRAVEIIPGVAGFGWSSALLYHDPNLATGFPATARYVMEADTGRLIPDARVALPNGDFESLNGSGQFTGWSFYDGPGVSAVADKAEFHGGATSARCENFAAGNPAGNCRFSRTVQCNPNAYYTMSAWVKTRNFKGDEVRLLAIGSGTPNRVLTYTAYAIPSTTNGWTKMEIRFNTLGFTSVYLYCGVWGGQSGTIWFDDFQIREAGLCNVLRRSGTPLWLRNGRTGSLYAEGTDCDSVFDPVMLASRGDFGPYHTPPTLHRKAGGAMKNADTVIVTYYHPLTTVADEQNNGSVMATPSDPKTYALLADQAARLDTLLAPATWFLSHDEIRAMGWDSGDVRRGLPAAALLADNIRRSDSIFRTRRPGSQTYMWNDMVDSLHNAVNNYYLVNGDLRGIWDLIPKSIVIANWNLGNLAASMNFFREHGFRQITCPYYDAGNPAGIRAARLLMDTVGGVQGSMYTTWADDYSQLSAFADYMWGAGPYVLHVPLDSASAAPDSLRFTAEVLADPLDASDAITQVTVEITDRTVLQPYVVTLRRTGGNTWYGAHPNSFKNEVTYRVIAVNRQNLKRTSPAYRIGRAQPSGVNQNDQAPYKLDLSLNK